MDIRIGDILRMKKGHPCGGNEWDVLRVGMDFRLRCRKCGHTIMVPRKTAEKNLRFLQRDGVTYKLPDLMKPKSVAPTSQEGEPQSGPAAVEGAETTGQ